jgi:hypothetical protein
MFNSPIVKFFFWLLVFHILTAHRHTPWAFVAGLVVTPFHFVRCICLSVDDQRGAARAGVNALVSAWESGMISPPPAWIERRLRACA